MGLNRSRIWLGGLLGGLVWVLWSFVVTFFIVGAARYQEAQNAGYFLKASRYPKFEFQWVILLFILGVIMAHLYAWSRTALGPGPGAALKVGALVGFASGFPTNFGTAAYAPFSRIFPLGWMLEMWVGAILATLVAGFFYKE